MPTKLFRLLLYFSYFYLSIVFDKKIAKNAREFLSLTAHIPQIFVKQNSFLLLNLYFLNKVLYNKGVIFWIFSYYGKGVFLCP